MVDGEKKLLAKNGPTNQKTSLPEVPLLEKGRPVMHSPSDHSKHRKRRRDAGKLRLNQRDIFALTWIAQQYAIRLDHLQQLLGRFPGYGAKYPNLVSESAARDVVDRWEQLGYVLAEVLLPKEPFWIWLTRKGLHKVEAPYVYRNQEESNLGALSHLYAINTIRLDLEANHLVVYWTSERELLRGLIRSKGQASLHRPDGVVMFSDGQIIAIEAELSMKKLWELKENLLEMLRGEEYLNSKIELGYQIAQTMSSRCRSQFEEIWYFAPRIIRNQVRRARAKLLGDGVISEEEAERIKINWYPLALTDDEFDLEEREEEEEFDFRSEEEYRAGSDGERPDR